MQLYTNATIYPLDEPGHCASALLVEGGKVVATGERCELRDRAGGRAEEVDCQGRVILPGLVDGHVHAMNYAEAMADVDLRDVGSLNEAVATMAEFAATLPEGRWVTGGQWNANNWRDDDGHRRVPDRELLDRLIPDRPVAVWSLDLHTLWLNGAALAAVGIDRDTPDPRGGMIVRDSGGEPTGVLREDAATLAERMIPRVPLEARVSAMKAAQQRWLSQGLVGLHDFDGESSRDVWAHLVSRGEMAMRVVKFLRLDEWEWATEHGWKTGQRITDRYVMGGLKLFSDGALGSHTCHMSEPFVGTTDYGLPIASRRVLTEQVQAALMAGVSVAIHAIGDRANHDVLSAIAAARESLPAGHPARGLVHRIEHAQFLDDRDLDTFARLGVTASMQPRHAISDIPLLGALGPNDHLLSYPWKDIRQAGIPLIFGSDGPVEPTDPFPAIYAAMTRTDITGQGEPFQPENTISAWEALTAFTRGPAYDFHSPSHTGMLTPASNADFIAVDTDPFRAAGGNGFTGEYESRQALMEHALAVRDTSVEMTVVGGEVSFSR